MKSMVPLMILVAACSGDVTLDANHPVTQAIGPEGGSLTVEGLTLTVPAGALSEQVSLSVYPTERAVSGLTTASRVWHFAPEGTTFAVPVTVTMQADAGAAPSIWWTAEGDASTFTRLDTSMVDGWAVADILHFSEGVVADGDCVCDDDDDESAGDDDSSDDDEAAEDDDSSDDDEAADDDDSSDDDEAADDDDSSDDDEAADDDDDDGAQCACDASDDDDDEDDDASDDDSDDDGDDTGADDDSDDDTDADDDTDED